MDANHIVQFLASMGEPDMATEVITMHNRLEAFAIGLDKDCRNVIVSRNEALEG